MIRSDNVWIQHLDSELITPEYPECSIFNFLKQNAQKNLDNTAIEFEGKKTTYRKLILQIEETAKALINIGVKKSDVISIISINTPEVLMMIYAANRIGAVVNMIHPLSSSAEIISFIEKTNSSVILVLEQLYPKIEKAKFDNKINPKIIITRIVDSLPLYIKPVFTLTNKNKLDINSDHKTIYWNRFISNASDENIVLPEDQGTKDDIAMIMYSGGTTGTPKGVMLTNLNINAYSIQAFEVSGIQKPSGQKFLAILPLFHGFGFASGIHANLCKGVYIFLLPKFDLKKSVKKIFKNRINFIYAIPALFEAIIRSEYIEKKDLSFFECLICGGDKLQPKLNEKLQNYLKRGNSNAVFCEGYGQTECVAACLTNPYFAPVQKSVGILLPDMSAKIVEPGTQKEVPNGTDGELCINGPTVMKGYYKNDEETKKVIQVHGDGKSWLHTGDIFTRDDNGYFYFKQRISRMAISAGYNIYVTEVEKAITSCVFVSQCCVVGVNDRAIGQRIVAHVVLNNSNADKTILKAKIIEQCKKMLPEYSLPHEIRFRDELPVTNLGKVDFKKLENEN